MKDNDKNSTSTPKVIRSKGSTKIARRKRGQGESSVYQLSDGSWRGALSQGPKLPRKYFRGRTADDVRLKIRTAQATLDRGLPLPDEALTVRKCFERWMDAKESSLRRSTKIHYESTFRLHILPYIGNIQLARLTPTSATGLYSQLRNDGVGNSAIAHTHGYLNSMLNWAYRMDIVQRVVTAQVDVPRKSQREMRFLDEAEARRLLAAAEGERFSALVHLLLGAGLRIGEALALTWGDIDNPTKRVHVRKSLIERKGGLRVEATKTAGSVRSVPVPAGVLNALSTHRLKMNEESLSRGEDWTGASKPVFVSDNGTYFSQSNFSARIFKPLAKRAGIQGRLRVHDLRHSYASLALSRGASLAAVSRALGHQRISTTLDMYVHALPSDIEQLSEIMDAVYS